MPPDPPEKLSDARSIGLAARAVRRARHMTAQQVATAMNLPLRTYVEARYSDQYDASADELEWLMARGRHLRDLVADLCQSRIAELKSKAEISSAAN